MKPLVLDYLVTHSLHQLEDEHGVCARRSSDGRKVSLNYDQILVKNGDPLAGQCRGMVIGLPGPRGQEDTVGEVELLAWPMERFFNHGDTHAAPVDFDDPALGFYEKLDGTMIVLYWDGAVGRWHAATRSVPEADLPIRAGHLEIGDATFADLFFTALVRSADSMGAATGTATVLTYEAAVPMLSAYDRRFTYVFELTSPFNRIVVKYDRPAVTLLAARHLDTGEESNVHMLARGLGVPAPVAWKLRTADEAIAFVNQADADKLEGLVAVDGAHRRVKLKNLKWFIASRAKDEVTLSRRGALRAIIADKIDDVVPLVDPEVGQELLRMQAALRDLMRTIDARFAAHKEASAGSRKEFANLVLQGEGWTAPYFNLYDGRAPSALEWVRSLAAAGKLTDSALDTMLRLTNSAA